MISFVEKVSPLSNLFLKFQTKDQERINGVLAYLWAKTNFDKSLKVINAYQLIEIYLGKVEEIKSVFNLEQDILVITYGFNEFENKRQADIVLQTIDYRNSQGKVSWFVLVPGASLLRPVEDYMMSNNYKIIEFSGNTKNSTFDL